MAVNFSVNFLRDKLTVLTDRLNKIKLEIIYLFKLIIILRELYFVNILIN